MHSVGNGGQGLGRQMVPRVPSYPEQCGRVRGTPRAMSGDGLSEDGTFELNVHKQSAGEEGAVR